MKKIIKKSPYVIVLILTLVICAFVPFTLAWLSKDLSKNANISVGEINASINATFEYLENEELVKVDAFTTECFDINRGLLTINGAIKNNVLENYNEGEYVAYFLEDFKVEIVAKPEVASYMRVKVYDDWRITRTFHSFNTTSVFSIYHSDNYVFPFNLVDASWNTTNENNWYYDPITKYVYYSLLLEKDEEVVLPFIYGGDSYLPRVSRAYSDVCDLVLNIEVDIVQANRFSEVWNIERIPTGGAS